MRRADRTLAEAGPRCGRRRKMAQPQEPAANRTSRCFLASTSALSEERASRVPPLATVSLIWSASTRSHWAGPQKTKQTNKHKAERQGKERKERGTRRVPERARAGGVSP